jgi:hypothetical protein
MMSVHHSKADICWRVRHVCEVPEADSRIAAKRPLAGLVRSSAQARSGARSSRPAREGVWSGGLRGYASL